MSNYWLGVVLLSVIAIGILILPWVAGFARKNQDVLSNTQIIKQRMTELEREVKEGLISEDDKQVAIKELKLALVDETSETHVGNSSAKWMVSGGLISTLAISGFIYYKSNEVGDVKDWQAVTQQSSELAKRIVLDADPTVTAEDIEDFALAMRTKLIKTPDDHIGWLLLGRLHASLNRLDTALQAFEKAYQIAPEHPGVLSSYTQTLVMTGQEDYLRHAEPLLKKLVLLNPADANALGMLAVTSTQLGKTDQAIENWQSLKVKLAPNDPMQLEVDQRIAALGGEVVQLGKTSVLITVDIDQQLKDKIPADGYLFVFAQDANGQVKMPAAVVKSKLSDLPVSVELSDANAMMPTYKISQLNETRLVARISVDENVAQTTGELQGEVVVDLKPGTQILQNILIDKELL
ncbi:c-type cytochrome biogenesis protein CcmI [Aliiglaciecola sp. M165]|uniref:c-type cytochrome biogenesis protein CcmI n=1 Tax=Aliiglaciecola sp. M165 TaxID=2593649 RepID=UPI00117F1FFA|nr:c-type cytochrome biogenesis protein CcmI [Aliiglaciecola sp. M165]TRY31333.1 c-type cytochrome biogenesis protein CcmI [Aliiglaciecola sp. M165]